MILELITRAWAFYTIWGKKVQGKEKAVILLESDEKTRQQLEDQIQESIKDMRQGKKVLKDEVLDKLQEWKSIDDDNEHDNDNDEEYNNDD